MFVKGFVEFIFTGDKWSYPLLIDVENSIILAWKGVSIDAYWKLY